jgi:SAM-dependent methyltransferase
MGSSTRTYPGCGPYPRRVPDGRHQRDWEDLARLDPQWAILAGDAERFGGWDDDAFWATGRREVEKALRRADKLGHPVPRGRALEFGCGTGRVTRALAAHFDACLGLDISPHMVEQARSANADVPNVAFEVNVGERIAAPSGAFDLVYTRLVLQHVPGRAAILAYVRELTRVLAPGGLLLFQLPSHIPWRHRLQPQRRLYAGLRGLGVPAETLYRRLRLQPIRMSAVPVAEVTGVLEASGARVIEVATGRSVVESSTYYATREEPA